MKKKKYSKDERWAYWVGVGMCMAIHNDMDKNMGSKNSKIKNSLIAGYNADNYKNIGKRFM